MFRLFAALLALVSVLSCDKEIKNELLPEFKQKPVITSFISPGDTVMDFYVSSNQRIFGRIEPTYLPENLVAYLSDGSSRVALDKNPYGFSISTKTMPVNYGNTYKLEIIKDNEVWAEASTTVPYLRHPVVDADTVSYTRLETLGGVHYAHIINLKVAFSDYPGEKNYYRLFGKFIAYWNKDGTTLKSANNLHFENEYLSDSGSDGGKISVSAEDNLIYYYYTYPVYDSLFVKLFIFNIEEPYYHYHKSVDAYGYGDNPFSEFTPVYSNIKGGLGVFTSYSIDTATIRLK